MSDNESLAEAPVLLDRPHAATSKGTSGGVRETLTKFEVRFIRLQKVIPGKPAVSFNDQLRRKCIKIGIKFAETTGNSPCHETYTQRNERSN